MAINRWRGDAQVVRAVRRLFPINPQAGVIYTATRNRKDVRYEVAELESGDTYLNQACEGVVAAINSQLSTHPGEFREITASPYYGDESTPDLATAVDVTGPEDGAPFALTLTTAGSGGIAVIVTETVIGDPGANEKQSIRIPADCNGGTFTLTFDGQTTGTIAYNANAATVLAALEALSNIAPGDVIVTGGAGPATPWVVEFDATYGFTDVAAITGNGASLTRSGAYSVHVAVLTNGNAGQNEIQKFFVTATGGTFTLSFNGQTTGNIAYNASAGTVQTALEALSNIASGDVAVVEQGVISGTTRSWTVEFLQAYRNSDVPQITGDGTNLTGTITGSVSTVQNGSPATAAIVDLLLLKSPPFNYLLTFKNPTTSAFTSTTLGLGPGGEVTATELEAALTTILGPGNFVVTSITSPSTSYRAYRVRLTNALAGVDIYPSEDFDQSVVHLDNPQEGLPRTPLDDPAPEGLEVYQPQFGFWVKATVFGYTGLVREFQEGSDDTLNEIQAISFNSAPTGGTFTITYAGQTTGALAFNADAATVETAIEALSNVTSVTVTKSTAAGIPTWRVEFDGADAALDLPSMTTTTSSLTGGSVPVVTTQAATPYTNEVQRITLIGNPAGGTFTLSFGGDTTSALDFDATAAEVKAELDGLSSISSVTVTGSVGGPWTITFDGTGEFGENVDPLTGSGASLSGATVTVNTTQAAATPVNEQQQVALTGSPTGGTFTLTFVADTTAAIPYNASASDIQIALESIASVGSGNVVVTGASPIWTVEFIDGLGGDDVDAMTGDETGLTSVGNHGFTQALITAPTGPNWFSDAENWSLNTAPQNSDSLVFENSTVACKYGLEDLPSITPALIVEASFEAAIGLEEYNVEGEYLDDRPTHLKAAFSAVTIGRGAGSGSQRIKLDYNSANPVTKVHGTAQPESGQAVQIRGSGTTADFYVYQGSVGIATVTASDVAAIRTLAIGYEENQEADATVYTGRGITQLTTVRQLGGNAILELPAGVTITLVERIGGTMQINGSGGVTTILCHEGQLFWNSTGTAAAVRISGGGKVSIAQEMQGTTFTATTLEAGAELLDPGGVGTYSNGIVLDNCSLADVTLDLGTHKTLTVAAGP